jgi:hypothetical protein
VHKLPNVKVDTLKNAEKGTFKVYKLKNIL